MNPRTAAFRLLENEARALLTRLARVEPFALRIPTVPAAAIPLAAQIAIERHLALGRRKLRGMVTAFIKWLASSSGQQASPVEAQRKFTFLKMRFNAILAQLDIFADVLNQRSEHETGVWLSGLDAFAADALELTGDYYQLPPVICYLDRGPGAAIRRARTRLPGGDDNPVAIIRVPRERMIGSGIASSLVHEVGHQGAALLDLVNSLRPVLRNRKSLSAEEGSPWGYWERWISEILADLWAVAKLGVVATVGLISVVSLPRAFVFRVAMDDPHPAPWIRVKLSCALGQELYPHPQWDILARAWDSFYPPDNLEQERRAIFNQLEISKPGFVRLLLDHRPKALRGKSLKEVLASPVLQPARLSGYFQFWKKHPASIYSAPPSLVFAAIGQAKVDGMISPEEESSAIADLLKHWALKITLDTSEICAGQTGRLTHQHAPKGPMGQLPTIQ